MTTAVNSIALDTPAADFRLPATDGKIYSLADVAGEKASVIVFICNHCPYVIAVIDRLVADARLLLTEGIGFAAICANDATSHPEDSFENMRRFAEKHNFRSLTCTMKVRMWRARMMPSCTPDFFGFDRHLKLKYRGRLDEGRTHPPPAGARRELLDAMRLIAKTGHAPDHQIPSIGCSIKWKEK